MTDTERRMRRYILDLTIERATLQKAIRRLEDETAALQAQLARQAVKDSLRGMEGQ